MFNCWQAMQRGKLARREVEGIKLVTNATEEDHEAATKIAVRSLMFV